jgi:CxxC-x17-CxxC domain-containing protein
MENYQNHTNEITYFAETNFRNARKRFGIKTDDRRRHVYAIGQTGTGKTTLMENMVISDILAGHGVGVVDPHGEFAEKMINFVPKERIRDVIYFNPADMEYPIAFNAIEKVDAETRHLVASGLMGVFKKIWPDVWSPRMEYILNNTILALLEYPNSTLLGVNRMFSDKIFRKNVVDQLTDPVVKSFWTQEYAKYQQRYEQEATAAIQNKIGQFGSATVIRNIIGQPHSSFDFRKAMDEGKIIIMNLSKGRIGEDNSKLLGGMLITKLYLAAMSRINVPEKERRDFYLYVDEFQNFVTDSFAAILSEARKYRLNLIIANQYIGQLIHEQNVRVKDAVFGNVGTFIAFRAGAEDVEFLEEKQFGPDIIATDLLNLPNYNIYLRLMIDGVPSRPFSAVTLPPYPKPEISFSDEIIEYTRKTYGTPRAEVEKGVIIATGVESIPTQSQSESKPSFVKPARQSGGAVEDTEMFDAVCTNCEKQIKVPFKPDPSRPVYCKDCFVKSKQKSSAETKKVSLSQLKPREKFAPPAPRIKEEKPKKQRKTVDTEELKKILEETLPKE